jgi:hypothetical protein
MASQTCTITELRKLIKDSGYPFELSVAETLMAQNYDVKLSHHFFNPLRQQDSELDILATRDFKFETKHLGHVRCILELAIECKDNSLPYVLFGFPSPTSSPSGIVDTDSFYMKIRSTSDKFANYFAIPSLGDSRGSEPLNIKPHLHQFKGDFRFHQAAAVEIQNGKQKLHVTERLRNALNGLAGYVEYAQDAWIQNKKALVGMSYDPTIWVSYLVLVHGGEHYRYTEQSSLEPSHHTTLFTSFNSGSNSIPLTIDFIKHTDLLSSLKTIEGSFDVLSKHILRYLEPSPKPLTKRTFQP